MSDDKISISSKFPHPKLSTLAEPGQIPTFPGLRLLQKEVNANAIAIKSRTGGILLGHAVLTKTPAAYAIFSGGVEFEVPVQPPLFPVIPVAANETIRAERIAQHAAAVAAFDLYHGLDQILRALVIAAVPHLSIRALEDTDDGFSNVTTLQLLTHLWSKYGTISPSDRLANRTRMVQEWHPTTDIERLFDQLQTGADYAHDADRPIPDKDLADMGYDLVFKTGVFEHACYLWREIPANAQTYEVFCSHFLRAWTDRHTTTASVGFHAANAANAITDDKENHNAHIARLESELAAAKKKNNNTRSPPDYSKAPAHYCWTHGLGHNSRHTSATCRARTTNPDHQVTATASNKLGGSTLVQPRRPSTST
jgi:hypothetical protein